MSAPFDPAITALFGSTIADSAVHTASDYTETAIRVIASRGVELLGEYGESAGRVDTVGIMNSIAAKVGDTVTITTGVMTGAWTLRRKLADDGYHRTFEVAAA